MKKVISIFLSVLLLASSSGIAYAQHFCSGYEMLSEITLGQKHLSCEMQMAAPSCGDKAVTIVKENHCCENHFTQIKTDDNFAKASFEIHLNPQFVAAFASVFILPEVNFSSQTKNFYADYNPPPLEQDFQILYETFLI